MFEHPEGGKDAGDQFLTLQQAKNTAAECALKFCTLKLLFHNKLCVELQSELDCWNEVRTLDQRSELAIHVNSLIREKNPTKTLVHSSATASIMNEPKHM